MLISFLGGPDESSLSEGVGQKRNSGLRPRDSLIIIALQRPAAGGAGMWAKGPNPGERGMICRRTGKATTSTHPWWGCPCISYTTPYYICSRRWSESHESSYSQRSRNLGCQNHQSQLSSISQYHYVSMR